MTGKATSSGRLDGVDTALLEVPANSDATIRLLKARIKSLEEQLSSAMIHVQGISPTS